MDPRQQFADRLLWVFTTQLVVNVISVLLGATILAFVLYKFVIVLRFLRWTKGYMEITKSYHDLVIQERATIRTEVIEAHAQTRTKLDEKGEEIKQEIRQATTNPDAEVLAIITADEKGTITEWSGGATRLFHWKSSEAIGQNVTLITPLRYRDAHLAAFAQAVVERRRPNLRRPLALTALTRDGQEIPVSITLEGWSSNDGMVYSALIRRRPSDTTTI